MFTKRRTVILLLLMIIVSLLSVFLITFKETDNIVYADTNKFSGGDGKAATPYQISTADDFCALEDINTQHTLNGYFNVYFILTADIDLSGRDINPIGTQLYPFKGHVDGAGFSVKNVSIISTEDYTGLFGAISSDASLKNITVSGEVAGNSNVGGLVGLNQGSITGCINLANVKSSDDNTHIDVGGICGYNENVISDCYNSGTVHGYGVNTGGIVGTNIGIVSNCFNVGIVKSEYYGAGGIAGNNETTISKCYNNATITAYSTAGGIAGSNTDTGIIENTYNTGTVSVVNNIAGGICGGNEGAIYNSYNCQSITGISQKGGICGFISNGAIVDSCFSSSDRYDGKLTFRGNDYPNSAILRDVDIANGDALTNEKKAAALLSGRGAGVWTKRNYDETSCYYPELSVFYNSANSVVSGFSKNSARIDRQTTEVSLDTLSYVYDAKLHEPAVYRGEELLVRDLDYTIQYSNNLNVGEKDAASARITFINYFKGSVTKKFTITKQPITVKWSEEKFSYNGKVQHPTVTVESGKIGEENITFEYLYDSNIEMGVHTVTAQLDSRNDVNKNYSFEPETVEYEISGSALILEWSTDTLYYNGAAQHPQASIKSGIKENDSVELIYSEYTNNINAKTGYTVKVTCDNDNYSLNVTYSYEIKKRPITAVFETKDFYYTGKAQFPKISTVNNVVGSEEIQFKYKDYTNNVSANTGYSVIAELADTAINANYVLSETIGTYEIKQQSITVSFSSTTLIYNAHPQYPSVNAESGVVEGERVVFKISDYSANIDATVGEPYSITVTLDPAYLVNENYVLVPTTHKYGINQAKINIVWDESSLPLIYNAQPQHPVAKIISEVYDDGMTLSYGECNSINVGKHYSVIIESDNKNYIIDNVLEYEISPMALVLAWKDENSLEYNGSAQYPSAEIVTQAFDNVELIYGECKNVNVGQGYTIDIICDNENYTLVNELSYSITPKALNVVWENPTLIYNGLPQHPDATIEGAIQGENINIAYLNYEENFDVGVKYTIQIELDENNPANRNYFLDASQIETTYRINKKKLELINIKAVDRDYNGNTSIELEGGKLEGVILGDDVTFSIGMAVAMSATAGENKTVMYMPSLFGEHSYRYRITAPDITVNIYKAKFDTSTLSFNNLLYLYDGTIKSLQMQGEVPSFIQYEISGNEQSQVGEYVANVHFTYNETNVEPIEDIEAKWYIAASEYSIDDKIKVNILSGKIDYGVILKNREINNIDEVLLPPKKECLNNVNVAFYRDGEEIEYNCTFEISLLISSETINKRELKLYGLVDGELKEFDFKIKDSNLIFVTDTLTDFYITADIRSNALWIGLGISGGVLFFITCGTVLFVILKKKKQVVTKAALIENLAGVQEVFSKEHQIKNGTQEICESPTKSFVYDGIYCYSYQSFLASLNYKDRIRQKEICSYSAEKANRLAAGKGNGKRRDLYWQGQKIVKGSNEYNALIAEVKRLI